MRGIYTCADMMTHFQEVIGLPGDRQPGEMFNAAVVERLRDGFNRHIVIDNIDDLLVGPAYHSFMDLLRTVSEQGGGG